MNHKLFISVTAWAATFSHPGHKMFAPRARNFCGQGAKMLSGPVWPGRKIHLRVVQDPIAPCRLAPTPPPPLRDLDNFCVFAKSQVFEDRSKSRFDSGFVIYRSRRGGTAKNQLRRCFLRRFTAEQRLNYNFGPNVRFSSFFIAENDVLRPES